MKIRLLTSSALGAAGVLALALPASAQSKPTLTLGGYTEQIFGVGRDDSAFSGGTATNSGKRVSVDQMSEGEIHFSGSVTLDNGIKIRTRVELESNTESNTSGESFQIAHGTQGDTIDEHWMRISGAFGEIRLGSGDAAGMAMTTGYLGTWSTNVAMNHAFDVRDWVSQPRQSSAFAVNRVDVSSDGEHISYFSPRIQGLQVGVSYVPSGDEDVNNQRGLKSGGDHEGWSFGLNLVRRDGNWGIGLAGGYAFMNESRSGAVADLNVWGVAGRFDYRNTRVAVSWVDENNQDSITTGQSAGRKTLEVGARHIFGPNAVSLSYMKVRTDSRLTFSDNDMHKSVFLSYRRTLASGVAWHLAAIVAEWDEGFPEGAVSESNNGHALVTSIMVRF